LPTPTPTRTPTATPIPQLVLGSWLLPFEIGDAYDPATRAMGDLSFAGDWAVMPSGGFIGNGVLSLGVMTVAPNLAPGITAPTRRRS